MESEEHAYRRSLGTRMTKLDNDLKQLHGGEHEREERLSIIHDDLKASIASLGEDVKSLESDLARAMQKSMALIRAFKDSVRAPEYSRIQHRVESWGGESFVSREEFKRLLREELAAARR